MQVQFYQLLSTPLERALPKLLEKAYAGGYRTHVLAASDEQAEALNTLLWTYDPDSFLPHGSRRDAWPERQPVYLSAALDAPNAPTLLCITEGSLPLQLEAYARILDMFDGRSDEAVGKARERWQNYKEAGHMVSYFQQSAQGAWEQKA